MDEQKQATWRICADGYYPYCSNCSYEPPWIKYKDMLTPYCPNCGCKMSKESDTDG